MDKLLQEIKQMPVHSDNSFHLRSSHHNISAVVHMGLHQVLKEVRDGPFIQYAGVNIYRFADVM